MNFVSHALNCFHLLSYDSNSAYISLRENPKVTREKKKPIEPALHFPELKVQNQQYSGCTNIFMKRRDRKDHPSGLDSYFLQRVCPNISSSFYNIDLNFGVQLKATSGISLNSGLVDCTKVSECFDVEN